MLYTTEDKHTGGRLIRYFVYFIKKVLLTELLLVSVPFLYSEHPGFIPDLIFVYHVVHNEGESKQNKRGIFHDAFRRNNPAQYQSINTRMNKKSKKSHPFSTSQLEILIQQNE